jgi:hypothetical protein
MKKGEKEAPVIFWAHFKSTSREADRMQRFPEGKESHLIFEWIKEERKKLEETNGDKYVMTNCGVIK